MLLSALALAWGGETFAQAPVRPSCSEQFATIAARQEAEFLREVLDMHQAQLAGSVRAQTALYNAALGMSEEMNRLGQAVLKGMQRKAAPKTHHATAMDHRYLTVRMKRDEPSGFLAAIVEKMSRKGYQNVKQVSDLARGRIDLERQSEVLTVVDEFMKYGEAHGYRVKVQGPRRPLPGKPNHFGYPRYHLSLTRADGLEFEWQIGVGATTEVWERPGIRIPHALKLPPGTTSDLHDIEYRIFQPLWRKAHMPQAEPGLVQLDRELKLKEFSEEVDRLAAESALFGHRLPQFDHRIRQLHEKASRILKRITDKRGTDFVDSLLRASAGAVE